ncbi:MAG: hypothetical protein ABEH43_04040 [Flavobacteriales bacterium]
MLKDFFETKALETGYLKYGSQRVNFSIGRFQMKPSFIESLEKKIKKSDILRPKYGELIQYPSNDPENIRKERVNRLQSTNMQWKYLVCFYELLSQKFSNKKWDSRTQKLKFYSTAYNCGIGLKKQEIKSYAKVASHYYKFYKPLKTIEP